MTVKVSVIIPVYNAGTYIDRPISSVLKQSMPQEDIEVIFVNDGSTDDSEERLQELAEHTDNFRVFTIPNSGWPGRPRNVGVANARGEYVHYLDQDDALGLRALEVMYERGRKNNSDVVVGVTKGNMRGPNRLFRQSYDSVGPELAELYETLTPHKMFRRQFLLDNDITFVEGPCRIEDQMFLAKAYPLAKSITVVSDVICYDWSKREDGGNNSNNHTEPEDYYPWLVKVARDVIASTDPGPARDNFLARNYRVEVLRNTASKGFLRGDPFSMAHYAAARKVAVEEYPDSVREVLPALWRYRAELMEADRVEDLRKVANRYADVVSEVEFSGPVRWQRGVLVAPYRARLRYQDGGTVKVRKLSNGYGLDLALVHGITGGPDWSFKDLENRAAVDFQLRQRGMAQVWFAQVDHELSVAADGTVELAGTVRIDPDTAACGGQLPRGIYDIHVNVQMVGIERTTRVLGGPKSAVLPCGGERSQVHDLQAAPYWTMDGKLALDIGANLHKVAHKVAQAEPTMPQPAWRKVARKVKRALTP